MKSSDRAAGSLPSFATVLAFFTLMGSGCGASYDGWSVVRSKHFALYTDGIRYPDTLRALENSYSAFVSSDFFKAGAEMPGPIEVLFLDDPEFQGLFGQFRKGAALAKVPGDGTIGKNGLLILRPHTFQTLDKEISLDSDLRKVGDAQANLAGRAATEMLAHLFIQRVYPKAPLWLHEGLATYLNTADLRQTTDGRVLACFGFVQRPDRYIGLPKLWDMTFEQYADASVRGWFPATAYVFVDYLLHGDNNAHRGKVGALIVGLGAGEPSEKVVRAVFDGMAIADLDKKIEVHRTQIEAIVDSRTMARDLCPIGALVNAENRPEDVITPRVDAADPEQMEALFRALKALPMLEEYPPYYPLQVVEKVRVPGPGTG